MTDSKTDVLFNGGSKTFTNFEELLEIVGDYGTYQKRMIILFLIPTSMILPFVCMNNIFLLSVPNHWCRQPELDALNFTHHERELLRPLDNMHDGTFGPSHCHAYQFEDFIKNTNVTDFSTLKNLSTTFNKTKCRKGWDYDQSLYTSTVATQWDLVCDNDQLPTLVFTLGSVGSAAATPVYSAISDRYGRKPVFMLTVIIAVITSGLTVVVPTFVWFTIVRSINGSAMPCAYQLPYVILMEVIGADMRGRINGISCVAWTFGLALMPLLAYLTANWITFGWLCFAAIIPYLGYYWYLPESARWLMTQKKYDETAQILIKIADKNGVHLPDEFILSAVKKLGEYEEKSAGLQEESTSPLDLVKTPRIRKHFLILCLSCIGNSVSYYAFHINVNNLAGNEFMNFFYLAIVELPSYLVAWYGIQSRLGRRWCNVIFTFIMAVACFTPAVAPADIPEISVAASVIGKFGNCASFLAMYQQATELFPTAIRASGLGCISTASSIFSICTPYIIYLGEYGNYIPFLMIACIALMAGIAAMFLPETLNENLPQTILEGELFGKNNKFFSLADTKVNVDDKKEDTVNNMEMERKNSLDNNI